MNFAKMYLIALRSLRIHHTRQREDIVRPIYDRMLREELDTMPALCKRTS